MKNVLILFFFASMFSQNSNWFIHFESIVEKKSKDMRLDYEELLEGHGSSLLIDAVSISYIKTYKGAEFISSNSLFSIPLYIYKSLPKDSIRSDNFLPILLFVPFIPNLKFGNIYDESNYFIIGQNTDYYLFYDKSEVYTETLFTYERIFGSVMVSNTLSYCWNGAYSRKKGFHYRVGIAYVFGE